MIHYHNQNTRFRSITDCFYCIVVEEIKIFFNLLIHNNIKKYKIEYIKLKKIFISFSQTYNKNNQ